MREFLRMMVGCQDVCAIAQTTAQLRNMCDRGRATHTPKLSTLDAAIRLLDPRI